MLISTIAIDIYLQAECVNSGRTYRPVSVRLFVTDIKVTPRPMDGFTWGLESKVANRLTVSNGRIPTAESHSRGDSLDLVDALSSASDLSQR